MAENKPLVKILWMKGSSKPYFRYTDTATRSRPKLPADRVRALVGADASADAEELRTKLEAKLILRELEPEENRRLTLAHLFEKRKAYWRSECPGYLVKAEAAWESRLKDKFAHVKVYELTAPYLNEYRAWARGEDAGRWPAIARPLAKATINGDMSILSGMYSWAKDEGQITRIPVKFRYYDVSDNVREGFLEHDQYDALVASNPPLWLRGVLAVGYNYGLRKNEMLGLRVSQIDFLSGRLNLKRVQTKNRKPRFAILTAEVMQVLAACVEGKKKTDFVFTRAGNAGNVRITNTRYDWEKMIAAAGITIEGAEPGEEAKALMHDMRRSAVRNMVRSGIPESVIMRIIGHSSRSMLDRYNIGSEEDMVEAARKIAAYAEEQRGKYEAQQQAKAGRKGDRLHNASGQESGQVLM